MRKRTLTLPLLKRVSVSLYLFSLYVCIWDPGRDFHSRACRVRGKGALNKKRTKTLTTESARWLVGVKQVTRIIIIE